MADCENEPTLAGVSVGGEIIPPTNIPGIGPVAELACDVEGVGAIEPAFEDTADCRCATRRLCEFDGNNGQWWELCEQGGLCKWRPLIDVLLDNATVDQTARICDWIKENCDLQTDCLEVPVCDNNGVQYETLSSIDWPKTYTVFGQTSPPLFSWVDLTEWARKLLAPWTLEFTFAQPVRFFAVNLCGSGEPPKIQLDDSDAVCPPGTFRKDASGNITDICVDGEWCPIAGDGGGGGGNPGNNLEFTQSRYGTYVLSNIPFVTTCDPSTATGTMVPPNISTAAGAGFCVVDEAPGTHPTVFDWRNEYHTLVVPSTQTVTVCFNMNFGQAGNEISTLLLNSGGNPVAPSTVSGVGNPQIVGSTSACPGSAGVNVATANGTTCATYPALPAGTYTFVIAAIRGNTPRCINSLTAS